MSRMLQTERQKLLKNGRSIHKRMINQEEAVTAVANAVRPLAVRHARPEPAD
ncbi:MAG: hypothetical protein U0872_01780 [Planctomycetaceae bacterium]